MDVRIMQTLPFKVTDVKELVRKIISEGTVSTGFPPQTTSINIGGLYFIAGGRKSISSMLNNTPNVIFKGRERVGAKMTRVRTQHKHFTVITIAQALDFSNITAYSAGYWSNVIPPYHFEFSCFDLVNAIWSAEAKIAEGLAKVALGK